MISLNIHIWFIINMNLSLWCRYLMISILNGYTHQSLVHVIMIIIQYDHSFAYTSNRYQSISWRETDWGPRWTAIRRCSRCFWNPTCSQLPKDLRCQEARCFFLVHWAVIGSRHFQTCVPQNLWSHRMLSCSKNESFLEEPNCTSVFRFQPLQHASRLIGRKFHDSPVQADMKHWPFKVLGEVGWRSTDIWRPEFSARSLLDRSSKGKMISPWLRQGRSWWR